MTSQVVPLAIDCVGEPAGSQLAVPAISSLEEWYEHAAVVCLEEPSKGPPANVLGAKFNISSISFSFSNKTSNVDFADDIRRKELKANIKANIYAIESSPCFVPGPCSPGQSQLKVARFI